MRNRTIGRYPAIGIRPVIDGRRGADIITLCSILRIPVCMHNVPESDIFRPASWNAFGMDKEGQDYRACATYGARYAKGKR